MGKRTVERIEAGEDAQMSTIIQLLRILELMDGLEHLVPETGPRPMELLKLKGKERKRASSKRATKPSGEWHWGEKE